jgi:hypothetical protein
MLVVVLQFIWRESEETEEAEKMKKSEGRKKCA